MRVKRSILTARSTLWQVFFFFLQRLCSQVAKKYCIVKYSLEGEIRSRNTREYAGSTLVCVCDGLSGNRNLLRISPGRLQPAEHNISERNNISDSVHNKIETLSFLSYRVDSFFITNFLLNLNITKIKKTCISIVFKKVLPLCRLCVHTLTSKFSVQNLLGTDRWRHLYCVFTYICSLLIEKDFLECRNV